MLIGVRQLLVTLVVVVVVRLFGERGERRGESLGH